MELQRLDCIWTSLVTTLMDLSFAALSFTYYLKDAEVGWVSRKRV